jgi:hypothetical protein
MHESLQQRALQVLSTAEEGSPAYIRAMAAFETPASAIDAEEGLPEHLAPPAYADAKRHRIIDHMTWTTDGKGDEPGKKRRLTPQDWKKMETWREMLAKEKAGESSKKAEGKTAVSQTVEAQAAHVPEASTSATPVDASIIELLNRSSAVAASTRTQRPRAASRREPRETTERRQQVDSARARERERVQLRFSQVPSSRRARGPASPRAESSRS